MAQHKSAVKRIRRNNRANVRNSQYMAAVRTAVKKFRAAAASALEGKLGKDSVRPLFVEAQSALAKAATKGIIHTNNASRKIGRLAAALKTVENTSGPVTKVAKKVVSKKSAAATVKAKKAAKVATAKPKNSTPAKKAGAKKK